jgi:hypothetical protein
MISGRADTRLVIPLCPRPDTALLLELARLEAWPVRPQPGCECLSVDKSPRLREISNLRFRSVRPTKPRYGVLQNEFVLEFIISFIVGIRLFFRSRSDTALEVLALRQQVAVLKRKRPRPKLNRLDRLFWTTLRHY